ncbi:hypothetical protein LVQ78_23845 [Buttiauxella sp. A2-C2_NF]|jgi:hypothetical protein|uniref:hypothetical protein n=1 Tax=Buttiauxella TaxID=82976 RepID=UPI001E3C26CD|nr:MULTISPECIES: hypothetical protein [Buttiauxella]MCE0829019.1 hypothetical protein [Buttiauxella ferragutiae]UNK63039.1 hypothetical protein MNO13_09005 [Buttiauxella ferragutiae]
MTTNSFLDEMKKNFLYILSQKSSTSVDIDDLSINYNDLLDCSLTKYLTLLQSKAELLALAKKNNDEIAMQSALLKLRAHAMSLSSFFDAIGEDVEKILRTGKWAEIPKDYKVPAHYNDPPQK